MTDIDASAEYGRRLASMEGALRSLDDERLFGTGADRAQTLLLVSPMPPDETDDGFRSGSTRRPSFSTRGSRKPPEVIVRFIRGCRLILRQDRSLGHRPHRMTPTPTRTWRTSWSPKPGVTALGSTRRR